MSTSNLAHEVDVDVSSTSLVSVISAALSDSISSDPPPNQLQASTTSHQKAMEVLQIIRGLGYVVQKDEQNTPLDPNSRINSTTKRPGNLLTCEVCHRFQGLPSELRKHVKRHERPYGCTFAACTKTFGSKNDWKRHENSQHFHLETWRCNEPFCGKLYYRRQTFYNHVSTDHDVKNIEGIELRHEASRIGRNCQKRFWCGFCRGLVDLRRKGLDGWTERYDHIDDHFMGRNGRVKRRIETWMPVDMPFPEQAATQAMRIVEPTISPPAHIEILHQHESKRKASPSVEPQRKVLRR
ncbi:hypothetical protein DL98DRAFT_518127 [Cadophora sp. DSE1049]|nr:hypothetical protein DL98DRAFT_518127 [Cadophora sp. DSE1049]